MKYKNFLYLVIFFRPSYAKYPTPRWLTVCRSSNISRWFTNTTTHIHNFFQYNDFDILYM